MSDFCPYPLPPSHPPGHLKRNLEQTRITTDQHRDKAYLHRKSGDLALYNDPVCWPEAMAPITHPDKICPQLPHLELSGT
jgi:hypothetical protein